MHVEKAGGCAQHCTEKEVRRLETGVLVPSNNLAQRGAASKSERRESVDPWLGVGALPGAPSGWIGLGRLSAGPCWIQADHSPWQVARPSCGWGICEKVQKPVVVWPPPSQVTITNSIDDPLPTRPQKTPNIYNLKLYILIKKMYDEG